MDQSLRIILAQQDFFVGDVIGNTRKIIHSMGEAARQRANLIVFPELTLTSYPIDDLLWRPAIREQVERALMEVCQHTQDVAVVIGFPEWGEDNIVYNSAAFIYNQKIELIYRKQQLPNYAVFDEQRYFSPGDSVGVFQLNGTKVGISICEDIWFSQPAAKAKKAGAQLLVNMNASPYHREKSREREDAVMQRTQETGIPIVYVNLVGGQDELVFDGASFVIDEKGHCVCRLNPFEEILGVVDFKVSPESVVVDPDSCEVAAYTPDVETVYKALVLGVKDYIKKNGFTGAVIGLSGGIDSALTIAIAVDALGHQNVEAVMLPSRYTSNMSREDARALANRLDVEYREISIEKAFEAFLETLEQEFDGLAADVTEENIQARCRGVILMAISNKKGKIVLTTGNKSEMAMGYSTLYGDMAGGFNVLKDVPKTLVYQLSEFVNRDQEIIPRRIIDRPPSAELRPDQKDEDSLPPYTVLDDILERYVEQYQSVNTIIAAGFDAEIVRQVIRLLDRNEYKRRQAPPGVKITPVAFGKDRRYPITSGYSESNNMGDD